MYDQAKKTLYSLAISIVMDNYTQTNHGQPHLAFITCTFNTATILPQCSLLYSLQRSQFSTAYG